MACMKGPGKCGELAALLAVTPLGIFHAPLYHGRRDFTCPWAQMGTFWGSCPIRSEQWVLMLPPSLLFLINTLS